MSAEQYTAAVRDACKVSRKHGVPCGPWLVWVTRGPRRTVHASDGTGLHLTAPKVAVVVDAMVALDRASLRVMTTAPFTPTPEGR